MSETQKPKGPVERGVRPAIDNLEYLHQEATPGPWKHGEFSFMVKSVDAAFIVKMRSLLPEFISLWKAADLLDGTKPNGLGLLAVPYLLRAVEELNRKADDELA